MLFLIDLRVRWLEKMTNMVPKWWWKTVIYHGRIRKTSHKKKNTDLQDILGQSTQLKFNRNLLQSGKIGQTNSYVQTHTHNPHLQIHIAGIGLQGTIETHVTWVDRSWNDGTKGWSSSPCWVEKHLKAAETKVKRLKTLFCSWDFPIPPMISRDSIDIVYSVCVCVLFFVLLHRNLSCWIRFQWHNPMIQWTSINFISDNFDFVTDKLDPWKNKWFYNIFIIKLYMY